ncbi:MAG: alpha/beta fold hydrolase [Thermoleophilaceae bacterium]
MQTGEFDIRRFDHLAYVREGAGGFPLLLLHGWPETKRIWWRNIEPLARAGFDVVAPDLRGYGDSGLGPDGHFDTATQARDMEALLRSELGVERCVACGGDFGGVVAQDVSLRFPGLVDRLVLFNTIPPVLPDSPRDVPRRVRVAADYFMRQGTDAEGLAAELDSPEKRRRYVAEMYGPRFWAAPGAFTPEEVEFMVEPFGDAEHFRASISIYEYAVRAREWSEPPRLREPNPTPALILYGPEDHVIPPDFPERMKIAFPERMGPFVVPGAGHFLQWEQPEVLNSALRWFCVDLLGQSEPR